MHRSAAPSGTGFGALTSTAMPVSGFLPVARPPASPGSSPLMKVSSTSTGPASRSRPGRTSTDRSRCGIPAPSGTSRSPAPAAGSAPRCRPSGGRKPARGEPHRQRRARPVENRARRHRGPPAAAGAHEPAVRQPPAAGMAQSGQALAEGTCGDPSGGGRPGRRSGSSRPADRPVRRYVKHGARPGGLRLEVPAPGTASIPVGTVEHHDVPAAASASTAGMKHSA